MAKTKNTFDDLSNHLFEMLERLNDAEDTELDNEIKRAKAITEVSDKIISLGEVAIAAEKLKANALGEISFPRLLGGEKNET